uniref:DYW domain-containing protein n=1 Tax=Kalanchoe fedtschenkoi TaxID=63787 RepID=A0A7N0TLG9_KALFE
MKFPTRFDNHSKLLPPCRSICSLLTPISNLERPATQRPACVDASHSHISKLQALLQMCAKLRDPDKGKMSHGRIILSGMHIDTLTSNMLINMYSKCGIVGYARMVFDEMTDRSLVSWNTMISAYTRSGNEKEAFSLLIEMRRQGMVFSEFTVSSVLCACAANNSLLVCQQLHAFALKAAMCWANVFVATALVDVYAKCGSIDEAAVLFESMEDRSEVTWSSLMAGFVQNELFDEALALFHRSQMTGLEYNQFMISSAVCACAGLAVLDGGKQVHGLLCKTGYDINIFVASSLVDMYAKSGSIHDAYAVFVRVEEKNNVLWNAMIAGFSRHAHSLETMITFEKMQQSGLHPNEVTYVSVLSVCSHMGLVEQGRKYFALMLKEDKTTHNVLHYSCMVDILGRSGLVCEAMDLIKTMPFDATASMWGSLLSSCRTHGNVALAETASRFLFELEPENGGNHVLLSNVYANNRNWSEVANARKLLKESEAKKERGKSWIQIKKKVHTFMVGERHHEKILEIYSEIDGFFAEMEKIGYTTQTDHDLHDVEKEHKQELLRHHSEKLAMVYGHMCIPAGLPIRIMKNLRICGDCHSFMKHASTITGREIIVRDTNRFHHFSHGRCSCGEFW